MLKVIVDFSHVDPHQAEMDERLNNWARWSFSGGGAGCSPMFRLYRSTEGHQEETRTGVDSLDAQKVQKGVSALPSRHRLAVSWCYIKRNNPRRAAQDVGASMEGLALLIRDGRQMLINREV
jgi:hypothetical protein